MAQSVLQEFLSADTDPLNSTDSGGCCAEAEGTAPGGCAQAALQPSASSQAHQNWKIFFIAARPTP